MNHHVTTQRLTSAHPLSFLFWTEVGNATMRGFILGFSFGIVIRKIISFVHFFAPPKKEPKKGGSTAQGNYSSPYYCFKYS